MNNIVSWLVNKFGVVSLTMWAISILSTILERVVLFAVCAMILTLFVIFIRRIRSSRVRFAALTTFSFILFGMLYITFPFYEYPFPVTGYLFPGNHPFATALVLALFLAAGSWQSWWPHKDESGRRYHVQIGQISAAVLVSGVAALLLNGWALRPMARALHADPAVQQFAKGDFSGLEFDAENHLLFACGHGTRYLLAFQVDKLSSAPLKSQVEIDGPQSFAFNPKDQELYVANAKTETVFVLDATTLALKHRYSNVGITPGDVWVNWDQTTGHIFVASEVSRGKSSTIAIDQQTGQIRSIPFAAYITYQDPTKPWLYMDLEREPELVLYDTKTRKIIAHFNTRRKYLSRMGLNPDHSELLVSAPVNSAVLRLNAETLAQEGKIDAVFGVRTVAVDPVRNLLFVGSLTSNLVELIDLKTSARIAKYFVGPWLRTIALDTRSGTAYVSSIEGLFRIRYGSEVSQPSSSASSASTEFRKQMVFKDTNKNAISPSH